MTLTGTSLDPPAPWYHRSELDLTAQQLRAITRFNDARRMAEQAAQAAARSREMRMDATRSLEVLRREHDAVISRAHEQLRASGDLLRASAERRVVLVHRDDWFVRRVAQRLEDRGLCVVATLDNGADAVGLTVAEQPDLVLVEDTLAMVPGEQVVRDVRRFCPDTVVAAQVEHRERTAALLQAGAVTVFARRTPPVQVADELFDLLMA